MLGRCISGRIRHCRDMKCSYILTNIVQYPEMISASVSVTIGETATREKIKFQIIKIHYCDNINIMSPLHPSIKEEALQSCQVRLCLYNNSTFPRLEFMYLLILCSAV